MGEAGLEVGRTGAESWEKWVGNWENCYWKVGKMGLKSWENWDWKLGKMGLEVGETEAER